jgi:aminoglycoside phosphotransferase (APT) family kinase protein
MADEARKMEYVRQHGYPVPAIEEMSDDGTEMVMERVNGGSMLEVVSRRPWTVSRQGALLADLHRRLHEIPAPDWFPPPPFGDGDRVIHLDLHPLNVMIGDRGPVVIDWPNATRGDGNADVALAWLLVACGDIPGSRVKAAAIGKARSLLINGFLRGSDRAGAASILRETVDWKVSDGHMSDDERVAMRRFADRYAR